MEDITLSGERVEDMVSSGLLGMLDADLLQRYPGEPTNGVDADGFHKAGGYFIAARHEARIVGCGAFRPFDAETVEIKRMYVVPLFRGRGVSRMMLDHLETEARNRGYLRRILRDRGLRPIRRQRKQRLFRQATPTRHVRRTPCPNP